jgi:hypothetical protein
MKLLYPSVDVVQGLRPERDAFLLLRWSVFLPEPELPHEFQSKVVIEEKLMQVDKGHRETLEKAVGYR